MNARIYRPGLFPTAHHCDQGGKGKRFLTTILSLVFLASGANLWAQTTYFWRSEAGSGAWEVEGNWWNGSGNAIPSGNDILRFGNNSYTDMTNNLIKTSRYQIWFDSDATTGRTIAGTTENTFYDYGTNMPKIENSSSVTHTINFPIKLGYSGGLEINPVSGDLAIGGAIDTSGYNIKVYGNKNKTLALSGIVSGSGGLMLEQNSVVLLNNANTYTGATAVDAGTLVVNGNQSGANGNVTVASGATLAGEGTVGGGTTVSGTHAPGNGTAGDVGSQAFSSTLTYNSGSIFEWDVTSDTSYDQVTGISSLSGSGGIFNVVTSDISSTFWNANHPFNSVFNTGTLSSVFSSFQLNGTPLTNGIVAGQGTFTFNGSGVQWTAVPELSNLLIGGLLGAGLLLRRRAEGRGAAQF